MSRFEAIWYFEMLTIIPIYKNKVIEWLYPKPGDVILEIGSGSGDLLRFLKQTSPNSFGADINEYILKKHSQEGTIVSDATQLALRDNSVDKSVSLHTLEHIPNLSIVFKELDRVTTDRGVSLHVFPSALIRGIDGALVDAWRMTHNPIKLVKIARQLHVHNLNPSRLTKFLEGTSWKIIKSERLFVPEEK